MKGYLRICLLACLLATVGFTSCLPVSKKNPYTFVKMEVKGVRLDAMGQSSVVILTDEDGKKALPIWIGLLEAHAIDKELKSMTSPRPMTHDLLHSILGHVQAKVKEVRIVDLRDHTYYATLILSLKGMLKRGVVEVDARPSDAIVLALKSKAPVFVAAKVLDQQGISMVKKEEQSPETYGIRVQELTPSLASHFNFKGQGAVLVSEVVPGSVSERSGMKAGDIITKVDDKEVGSVQEFEGAVDAAKGAAAIRMSVFRDDAFAEINLPLRP